MKITATLLIYCDIDNTELSVVGVSSVHMMSTSEGEDQITDQQIQVRYVTVLYITQVFFLYKCYNPIGGSKLHVGHQRLISEVQYVTEIL